MEPGEGATIVTGAGAGIGRAVARRLAGDGSAVILVGRRVEPLQETAALIGSSTVPPLVHPADVTDEDAVHEIFEHTSRVAGAVQALVACAAITGPVAPIVDQTLGGFEQTLRSNVTSAFLTARAAASHMMQTGGGRIVLIGSVTGKRPLTGRVPYAASKTALIGLTRTLAVELGPHDVTVNLVSPGAVHGERLEGLAAAAGRTYDDFIAGFEALTALGRISTGEDVAAAVAFLLSGGARNITGIDLNVDAGVWFS